MVTEDYVSFEVAKLLKEKGFDGDTSCYYTPHNEKRWVYQHYQDFDKEDRIEYPTIQMAMKWLRKNHKIHIDIDYIDFLEHGEVWSAKIVDMVTFKETKVENTWNHYEQMANEAIKFYLKNLNK